ncbi:uncharacterized protein SETTUDRAFT_36012 [Exserohilum turcica Et28A]|uniref:Heterokaryon incompatibility domain-containing protein n=1 Tax=Exserohilum turcicum (strain 28A) TaxID=671987 RepID=R0JIJ1_EXST2|nr:uncharacterized protein SETTUDRAFT_36012 [Exserohilum turcica Et28A]EOA81138.1 hypothetical protein SETTUDRAFT_36012 [Exserohilum turcica Et28A]
MAEAEWSRYTYQPLDENNNEIRLITLLPSADTRSEIVCDIKITPLVEGEVPRYEALSYVWGSTIPPCKLRVSPYSNECIEITNNLAQALHYLRDKSEPRVLWIDAITINQQDIVEKSSQVQRMAEIYPMAERVIVWLGVDDADSETIMKICTNLNEKVWVPFSGRMEMYPRTDDPEDAHWSDFRIPLPYDQTICQAIARFLQRPWFHRLWIWQEIGLANVHAVVLCGSDTMPWQYLVNLLTCIGFKMLPDESARAVKNLGRLWQNSYNIAQNRRNSGLLSLLQHMQLAQCADLRDRVYGMLGLWRRTNPRVVVKLDYNQSVADVYLDFARSVAKQSGSLELLAMCEYDDALNNWPSWAPLLSKPNVANSVMISRCTGNTECAVEFSNDGIMKAAGLCIDHVATFDVETTSTDSTFTKATRWMKMLDMDSLYVDGKPVMDTLCRVLCTGQMDDICSPAHLAFPNMASSLTALPNTAQPQNTKYVADAGQDFFWRRANQSCAGRNLFTTSQGYIGLGPLGLRKGDQICLLLGFESSLIIRPTHKKRFKVIGQCYLAGVTNGEPLLGALSPHHRMILVQHAASYQNYWTFLDSRTGKVDVEDPRLESELPRGWRRVKHELDDVQLKFAHDSNPGKCTQFDPRLSRSELLRRGVPLEDIEFS